MLVSKAFYNIGLVSCLSPYGIEEDSRPWGPLMFWP